MTLGLCRLGPVYHAMQLVPKAGFGGNRPGLYRFIPICSWIPQNHGLDSRGLSRFHGLCWQFGRQISTTGLRRSKQQD